MSETLTGDQFAQKYGIIFDWDAKGYRVNDEGWEHQRYRVKLATPEGKAYITIYRMGMGLDREPQVGEVLESLSLDIRFADQPFEGWADEYGYDTDSRKAKAIWMECVKARKYLERWCSSEEMWEDLLNIDS